MNSKLNYVLIAVVFLMLFSSCSEEDSFMLDGKGNIMHDDVQLVELSYSIEKLAENSEDLGDERINKELLRIADEMKVLVCNSEFKKDIYNNIDRESKNLVFLSKFKTSQENDELYLGLMGVINEVDLNYQEIECDKSDSQITYTPAIYIPNMEIADFDKDPILSLGFEVDNELPGLEDYENHIVAWVYDEEGNAQETLINEEFAMSTSHPVLILTNAIDDTIYKNSELYIGKIGL